MCLVSFFSRFLDSNKNMSTNYDNQKYEIYADDSCILMLRIFLMLCRNNSPLYSSHMTTLFAELQLNPMGL